MLMAVGARAITLVVSLVCGVLTARLVLGGAGIEDYALYALITALPGLVTFFDLGSGAVIVNGIATSDDPRHDESIIGNVTTVIRIIVVFAGTVMAINALLFGFELWPMILGEAGEVKGASLAAFVCVTIFCLGLPLNIWQRVLLGFGRNHIIILVQGAQAPIGLLIVWALLTSRNSAVDGFLSIGAFVAALIVGVVGFWLSRRIADPMLREATRRVPRPRRYVGRRVMDVGWPMLAQLVGTPLSMTLQRFLLAQFVGVSLLAEYAAVGQVFFAMQGLVGAAGLALWPTFTKARHHGLLRRGPFALSAAFAGCVVAATGLVLVVSPWLFGFISNDTIAVHPATIVAFGLMVACQGALFPLGMFIMDKPGIRFQVVPVLLMAFSSIVLTLVLTPSLGVNGPLIANAVSVVLFQIIPFTLYIRRHRDRLWSQPLDDAAELPSSAENNGVSL